MLFPSLVEISTKEIVTVKSSESLSTALSTMIESGHHVIIIKDDDSHDYFLVTSDDVIDFQLKNIDFEKPLYRHSLHSLTVLHEQTNVLEAMEELDSSAPYIGVVNSDEELVGLITHHDLLNSVDPKIIIERMSLKDLFHKKNAIIVAPNESIKHATQLMRDHNSNSVIVSEHKKAVGIVTTKDITSFLLNRIDFEQPIKNVMTHPVKTLCEQTNIKDALTFLMEENFRRIIVVDKHEKVVGAISRQEIINLVFNRWTELLTKHTEELDEINKILNIRAQHLDKLASTDSLTGVYNRTRFDQVYNYEFEKSLRYGQKLSVIMIDLDFFKSINDTYGHLVGDKILKQFAKRVQGLIRKSDLFARWGGEEFILLCPETTMEQAILVANKIRQAIENEKFAGQISITCSLGVAEYKNETDQRELMDRVDKALYAAKNSGRNMVCYQ